MPLQFFHIDDLCRFMEILIEKQPSERVFNTGNTETVDIVQWVKLCYKVLGKEPEPIYTDGSIPQRSYFPFLDYAYILDVNKQRSLMSELTPLYEGLCSSYKWYCRNKESIRRKPLLDFINENMK